MTVHSTLRIVYAGIEVEWDENESLFCIQIHDGFFQLDTYIGSVKSDGHRPCTVEDVENQIMEWLQNYTRSHTVKLQCAGIGILENKEFCRRRGEIHITKRSTLDGISAFPRRMSESSSLNEDLVVDGITQPFPRDIWPKLCPPELKSGESRFKLPVRLWREMDVLPYLVPTQGTSVDERGCSENDYRHCTKYDRKYSSKCYGPRHEVEVDFKGMIRLTDADDYIDTLRDRSLWKVLNELVDISEDRKLFLCYFSSTSQGGGVALMRHALIRLLRLLEVNAHWFVCKPKPEIFEITKRKFHNVLQGVAPPGSVLTEDDKRNYEEWCRENLCGIIPHIKRVNQTCKIIYRSHIEVRSDLVKEEGTQANINWNYLWGFIKECDIFVSHPVANFAPSMVPKQKLYYMGASTDLLDGLNKPLAKPDMEFYRIAFNRISFDQTGKRADFWHRPYIVQICRFDPSKGLPDVLRAYAMFRRNLNGDYPRNKIPQLIIAGTGSVDDPEGRLCLTLCLSFLDDEMFEGLDSDIIMARLPPSDQIMNTLMRGAGSRFSFQFVKDLRLRYSVIAYASGGIPLQVEHNQTGFLVKTGDYSAVACYLKGLLENHDLYNRLKDTTKEKK
ncbi:hypothetical protein BC829DRAFT_413068 [Chytridium lagenaria]|nr:hypothetical protein BC829DRAFT_413068 [Chytridium lagenaria]